MGGLCVVDRRRERQPLHLELHIGGEVYIAIGLVGVDKVNDILGGEWNCFGNCNSYRLRSDARAETSLFRHLSKLAQKKPPLRMNIVGTAHRRPAGSARTAHDPCGVKGGSIRLQREKGTLYFALLAHSES